MYSKSIVLGVLVSLIYTEITDLSAGLILPGYFALNIGVPWRLVLTLSVALLSVLICRLLAMGLVLYGRRRFAFHILICFFLSWVFERLSLFPGGVSVIGYVIPGILAREMDRQGIKETVLSLIITTGIVGLILVVIDPAPAF